MTTRRVLFFSEAVTLAHVARPAALAGAIAANHRVTLARAPWAGPFIDDARLEQRDLHSVPSSTFLESLRLGRPVYDAATLERYVEDDLALIDTERPDLVVGDFRLSLSISARLRGIPFVTITNAYWSPWYCEPAPLPVLPWTARVPLPLARAAFALARGSVMASHTLPINRVRQRFGLPSLGWNLRRVYTDADWLALADSPALYPTPGAPDSHRYLGPIAWSPPAGSLPLWWSQPRQVRPIAYLSLGSSGPAGLTGALIQGLLAAGFDIWHTAAGGAGHTSPDGRVFSAPWLPGELACQRADLVVCNGGSLGVQQALAAARPVIGVASNMDQFMNMGPIVQAGAGLLLRADRVSAPAVAQAASGFGLSAGARAAARRLSALQARLSAGTRFAQLVREIVGESTRPQGRSDAQDHARPDPGLPAAVQPGRAAGVAERAIHR